MPGRRLEKGESWLGGGWVAVGWRLGGGWVAVVVNAMITFWRCEDPGCGPCRGRRRCLVDCCS